MQNAREVSTALEEIAALLEFSGESRFKIAAYLRGAELVSSLGDELGPLVEQGRLEELEGVGPALSRQIEELWNSGASALLASLRERHPEGTGELLLVPGLTARRVRVLQEALGIRSVAELRAACATGRVRSLKGFGEKTEARVLSGCDRRLALARGTPEPMLLARGLELAELVRRRLLEITDFAEPVGALRRGDETLRELEFVVAGDAERALSHLRGVRQVVRVVVEEGVAHLTDGVRLKLHAAPAENLGGALFLTTGNPAHVRAVEQRASERGVEVAGTDFAREALIYEAAGVPFVPPELRTGTDELERAARGELGDLVEADDIQGMVHCHTTYSDGKHGVMEMALAAHALGMKYISITDHSPSARYARGLSLDRLKQQWDDIADAQERVPIRILRGTESDILADGSLDFPDAILEKFEIIVASIHARHRMDRATMTERLRRALAMPIFKIWGHALGRILNQRDAIDCDVPAVLDALASARGAVEINADPHRLDLPPAWIPAARERNLPFVISVDAHSTRGLGVLQYGVIMARRGGVRRHEVLNVQSAEAFAESVRPV